MLRLLRQPRYAALTALMVLVAIVCVGAGTWQIARFQQKRSENGQLRTNSHARPVDVDALLPLVGSGGDASRGRVEFRTIRATGTYDGAAQSLVRNRSVGDADGFLLLTPLRTSAGVLLVVRGFIASADDDATPRLPAPPSGRMTVIARAVPAESRADEAAQLPDHQVESINPTDQARRLGQPTFAAYAELQKGQPGSRGLVPLPGPDLSNPAGGAVEPQHFAYVIQWYLFAALALAAPLAMARAETRQRPGGIDFDTVTALDYDPDAPDEDARRAAKLADRYGRPVG